MEAGKHGCRAEALPWAHLRLPPFPQVALRVLQLVRKENIALPQLCELISTDAAFASEVLTVANSALYAPRYPSTSILQALTVLGARTLQGMCVTVGVRAYLGRTMAVPAMRELWRHNLACALIAERLASIGLEDKNICFTAGILHDLGRVALAVVQPDAYASILEQYHGPVDGILDRERALFGMDHCETGRQLVEEWRLPDILAPVVAEHHAARRTDGAWDVGELIKVSCRIADAVGFAAFAGCETASYDVVLEELPAREQRLFSADVRTLAAELAESIQAIEAL
jgi:putative nucleotidyltransferase with HDIG domain